MYWMSTGRNRVSTRATLEVALWTFLFLDDIFVFVSHCRRNFVAVS